MLARKSGFTLIMAIFMLVAIAGFMTLMLSYSSQNLKRTTDTYEREQAQLLARSATEYALLAISAHTRNLANGCISTINSTFNAFTISTKIHYMGLGALGTSCGANYVSTVDTPESNGTVIIDVLVKTVVPDGEQGIIYHKRTLQKP